MRARTFTHWLLALAATAAATGLTVPAAAPARAASSPGVPQVNLTDEMVVNSMRKGVDYLLSQKKGDHFETSDPGTRNYGGRTALVLYALLHTGQSLDDPRLTHRSAELAPVVAWLTKLQPNGTYAAAFQACALSMVPQTPETKAALERCRHFLMAAMDPDGGYTYDYGWWNKEGLIKWDVAGMLAQAEAAKAEAINDLKKALIARRATQGEANAELQKLAASWDMKMINLKKQLAELQKRPAPRKASKMEAMQELQAAIAETQKQLADYQRQQADPGFASLSAERQGGIRHYIKEKSDGLVALKAELEELRKNPNPEVYSRAGFNPSGDASNAQYALLGMWQLADAGLEVPTMYWKIADRYWRLAQRADGGWAYDPQGQQRRSTMTLAGVASLYVTQEFLDTELRTVPKPDSSLERGLAWLNTHFDLTDPTYGGNNLYFLYGAERIGLAGGLKFFGTNNWFQDGAAYLMKKQNPDGSWWGGFVGGDQVVGTSYGLMFLARGRNPVMFNKLQYEGPWNARPRDDANITHWMSKRYERPMNWQVVNLQVDASEWTDAPVLLITGSRDPRFTDADIAKLRDYIHAGGIIFSTADGSNPAFTTAMQRLAAKVTDGRYEMKPLEKTHDLFTLEAKITAPPNMLAVSNGSRLLWIHSTTDMGASWQMRRFASTAHFEIPANLYFYAAGRGALRPRLAGLGVPEATESPLHRVALARLQHEGNWNPEPGAWKRLAAVAAAHHRMDVTVTDVAPDKLDAKATPVAHVTGTSEADAKAVDTVKLKSYLDDGGLLLADATGGDAAFTDGIIKALQTLYPEGKINTLPADHALYDGSMANSAKIATIEWRKYALLKDAMPRTPALRAFAVDGRIVALLSSHDITSGLLGTNTWGIMGYAPPSAQDLAVNMLLFATNAEARKVASN